MRPLEIGLDHYSDRQSLVTATAQVAGQMWDQVNPKRVVDTWATQLPQITAVVTGAQLGVARQADPYVTAALVADEVDAVAESPVNPRGFSGYASDGRGLADLLANPAFTVLQAIGSGASVPRAMAAGRANLDMLVRTQVADMGRYADQVAMTARPHCDGYIRVAVGNSCARCLLLSGGFYQHNAAFQRHPRCDCTQVPSTSTNRLRIPSPEARYARLTPAQRSYAGFSRADQRAIADGADLAQVVNAKRGLYSAGGRQFTTEGTTKRGLAGQRLGAGRGRPAIRITPEQIYRDADGNRAEELRLLHRHGYLVEEPALAPVVVPIPIGASVAAGAGGRGVAAAAMTVRPVLEAARTASAVQGAFIREARAITGRYIPTNFVGSAATAREHAEGLLRGLERFPDAKLSSVTWSDLGNSYAETQGSHIVFGREWSTAADRTDYLRSLASDVDSAWHTVGATSPTSVALHEFGHLIDFTNGGQRARVAVRAAVTRRAADLGINEVALVEQEVSGYAATHVNELIGEAFADVMLRGEAASVLSREIFDILSAEYKVGGGAIRSAAVARSVPATATTKVAPKALTPAQRAEARRQAAIVKAQSVAGLAREVSELVANGASTRALTSRVEAAAKRLGTPPAVRDAILRAVATEDQGVILAAVESAVKGSKLTPINEAGAVSHFDRHLQQAVGNSRIADGAMVRVIRPGYTVKVGGESIQLERAVVRAVDPAEAEQIRRAEARAAARERARQIQVRDTVEQTLAELDELLAKKAARSVFEERLAAAEGIDPKDLALLRAAVGDATKMRAQISRVGKKSGIKVEAKAGAKVKYDPSLHDPVGAVPADGTPMLVIRRGTSVTIDGKTIVLNKATVKAVEAPARRVPAPKRANPPTEIRPGTVATYDQRRAEVLRIAGGSPSETRRLGGSSAYTSLLTYPRGDRLIEKVFGQRYHATAAEIRREVDAEQLGAQILEAIGVRAPAVGRVAPDRIAIEFIDGQTARELGISELGAGIPADIVASDDARLMGLADVLMGNPDRNTGNWLRLEGGRLAGIDHGGAFIATRAGVAEDLFDGAWNPFSRYLVVEAQGASRAQWAATNDLSRGDLATVRARLEALKPQFVAARHTNWYTIAMRRLNEIEKRATGTRNRIAR